MGVDKRSVLRRIAILLVLQVVLVGSAPAMSHAQGSSQGRYIVVLKKGTDPDAAAKEHGHKYGVSKHQTYRHAIDGYSASIPESRVDDVRSDPKVTSVYPDVPAKAAAQTTPTGVSRIRASSTLATGTNVNVAILDTGIDLDHADLAANIAGGKNCSDGSSYNDSSSSGHGTHVAGIVAAIDNTIGVRGVAPGAKLWAVRVLDDTGSGDFSSIVCGLDFVDSKSPAHGGPITVANLSIEATNFNADDGNCGHSDGDPLHQAVCRVVADGVTITVAAGNSAVDVRNVAPAAYNEVITASALSDSDGLPCGLGPDASFGADDTFASFSNYGGLSSDRAHMIGAPGDDIVSTWNNGGYVAMSGTSMASPHIAGAAALYIAENPGAPPAAVLAALKASGVPSGVNFNNECTSGASTTDPSFDHPEEVLHVTPSIFVVFPPGVSTGPVVVRFAGPVVGVDSTNLVLGLASGGSIPAAVTYVGASHQASMQPSAPLMPGEHYAITVSPQGSTPPTDANGDPLPTTTRVFRGTLGEQENSVWASYNWRSVSASGAYGRAYVRDRFSGAATTFNFTGSTVAWYTLRGPDQGLARVEIDGHDKGTFDNYRSSAQYRYRRAWSLAYGPHKIRIIALGKKNSHARDTYASVDAFAVGSTVYTNPTLIMAWHGASSSLGYGSRIAHDNTSGASAYYRFRGTRIDWRTILGPDQGKAKVYIDGVYKGLFDNYASSSKASWRTFGGLIDKVHVIRILVAGQKRSASKNTTVSIDYFLVV